MWIQEYYIISLLLVQATEFFHSQETFFPWNEVEDDGCEYKLSLSGHKLLILGLGPCCYSYPRNPVVRLRPGDTFKQKGYKF